MKKTNYILVLIFVFFSISINSQTKKDKTKKEKVKEQVEEVLIEVPIEVIDVEVDDSYYGTRDFIYINNKKYSTKKLDNTYSLYYKPNTYLYGVLKNNKVLLPNIFKYDSYRNNSKDKLILRLNNLYGLFNLKTESWILPISYAKIFNLKDHFFGVKNDKNRYAIYNTDDGKLDFKWANLYKIGELDGYYRVSINDFPNAKEGIYNVLLNKLLIPCEYESILHLSSSNLFLVRIGDVFNVVNLKNKLFFKHWYKKIVARDDLFIVKKNERMGVIDADEKEIIPIEYEKINTAELSDGSYLAINKKGKHGCITIDGKITLPFVYTDIRKNYYNNKVLVSDKNQCGIVRVNEGIPHIIIPCKYSDIEVLADHLIVEKNEKFGLLNSSGKVILKANHDKIERIRNGYNNDIFIASKKGVSSLINSSVTIASYKKIKQIPFFNKYDSNKKANFLAVQDENNKYGLIDKMGVKIIPNQFDDITYSFKNLVLVKNNDKIGAYGLYEKKLLVPTKYDQIIFDKGDYYFGISGNQFDKIYISGNTVEIKAYN